MSAVVELYKYIVSTINPTTRTTMKLIHRATLLFILAVTAMTMTAEIPSRYYSAINGKKDAELKTALSAIISKRASVSSYENYYSNMPQYFQSTDVYPEKYNGRTRWWDMYSNIPLYAPSFSGLNREHCVPKSWWGGATTIPIYADLNNLFPSEMEANMKKSNYPLGTVSGTPTYDNGVVKLGYPSAGQGNGASRVFEPADEYKGDFARTYFYMITCYENTYWTNTWMFQNSNYLDLAGWAQELLLKWHREDKVSQKELDRNDAVYKIQNNRNPFIDYPDLVEYIWGNKRGELFYEENAGQPAGDPILITPVQDMALDFNQVAIGNSTNAQLYFKGENLTGTLSLTITKPRGYENDDRAYFSIQTKSINSSDVNSANGYLLTVTYRPTVTGSHYARLVISDGGLDGSIGVSLKGEACPVPTLKAFNALPAEDVTATSYMAMWDEPDDVVDYYIVTRTRYTQGATGPTEELLAETNSLLIEDYDPSIRESYHVQSVRLGYRSPASNEIYVDNAGIDAIDGDIPLGTAYEPGGIRFICGTPHTGVTIYDMQGRTVATIERIENNSTVMLPTGIYFVTSRECHRPIRVTVR